VPPSQPFAERSMMVGITLAADAAILVRATASHIVGRCGR